jgi:hypothetical protein
MEKADKAAEDAKKAGETPQEPPKPL